MNVRRAERLILREVNRYRDAGRELAFNPDRRKDAAKSVGRCLGEGRMVHSCPGGRPDLLCTLTKAGRGSEKSLARRTAECWANSPPHRAYMTHRSYKKAGVAVRVKRNGTAVVSIVLDKGFWGI